jgi:GTPase SAR1 family protein
MDIFTCCRNTEVKSNNSPFEDNVITAVSQTNTQIGPPSVADKNLAINRKNIDIVDKKNTDGSDKNRHVDYSIEKLFNDIVVFQEKILTSEEFNKSDKNFMKIKKFDTPQILCVGTQTSGKSSLVNNIIGYELLPTGDNMVTRTPLNVSLSNGSTDTIQLYYIENGKKITTYIDKFSICDVEVLKSKIMETTDVITGGNYLISKSILYLEIVSLEVEDLVIIDLPGLISIACTDKGQPASMVGDIKELIECQLSSNRVFVIAVIQSKVDLETDGGLGLIKDLGRKFDIKTIGVLTKPDLLDTRSLVKFENIFTNDIPSDLQVDNGYYVVNNLIPFDAAWYVSFFGKKSAIVTQKKFGIINFKQAIKKHINAFLKGHAYEVRKDLVITKDFLIKNRPSLNNTVEESSSKILYMITVTYILHRILCESFNSTGNMTNIGGDIRDIFDSFTNECNNMDPFNKSILTDEKLNKIIKNFDGYLPSHTKKINLIVNKCIADEDTQPIKKIMKYVDKCVNTLICTVLELTKNIKHI